MRLTWPSTAPELQGGGETGDDGIAVAVDAGGKGMETGQIVLPDGDEPVRKTFALALGQHDGEGADVSGERVGLGAVGAHGFEQQLLGLGKGFRSPVVDLRGVQHLSLREIAREAGISHGQLQHYFASRQPSSRSPWTSPPSRRRSASAEAWNSSVIRRTPATYSD
ncbi:TetR/AcrR family transcriptional regulator [Streptomyces californicus]|uniref:TetR/AcrR family transcriptional regulator n=1 Tax=Streptomyces californicus TaxID=67351 RepID=UPI0036F962B8